MKSLTCEDVNKSDAPRMKTRRVIFILFTLALACFFGLPANSRAQGAADQFALRMFYYVCPEGACHETNGTIISSLVVMAGDGSFIGAVSDNPNDWKPAWSPDGTRIAFGRDGEIMGVYFPGGIPVNLTNHPADDVGATWSPDGSKIAFATNRDGQAEIYVMNADGTGNVRLTNSIGVLGAPAWSPDGTRIAFDCEVESGNRDICAVNVDGSGFVRLTSHPALDSGPAWSSNSSKIIFSTARYSADPTGFYGIDMQIAMMNNDGSGTIQIGPSGTAGYDPSFSPDGGRIVFTRTDPCDFMICPNVYVVNVDGSGEAWRAWGEAAAWRPAVPAPAVTLSPGNLTFNSQVVGSTSAPLTVSLTNTSSADLTISDIAASGDFTQTNNCGSSVATGASCTISVSFTPTALGPRSGAVTIMDSVDGSPHGIYLSGTGTNPNTHPVASFVSACTELTCTFDASASSDPDGTIELYVWDFGDGKSGSTPTISHTYAAGGTYSVRLTVTDNGGATGTQSTNVNVSPAVIPYMHVGDLDRTTLKQGNIWTASVTVTIHDGTHNGVSNVSVSGSWSTGGTGLCTTGSSGNCTVSKSGIPRNNASVTFTVENVTHATLTYNTADNHDPDGDSSGTIIAVNRP